MNDLDLTLETLGPQLLKGRKVLLTKGKQQALATWAVKTILMLQLVHSRQDRFVIPLRDYRQFHTDRNPGPHMKLWTGYMEPPGKHGGPTLAFTEYRAEERFYDEAYLARAGLAVSLACTGYSAQLRLGHCIIGLIKTDSSELAPLHAPQEPRRWTQIWPPAGIKDWPPKPLPSTIGLPPFPAGIPTAPALP